MTDRLENIVIITGHYGSGKTNFAVNLALDFAARGEIVTIADMDIVNPYFRTADFGEFFDRGNIKTIFPLYAGSNLDIPALDGRIEAAVASAGRLILDVGGDDAGATALGRYSGAIAARGYSMLYIVNFCRLQTATAGQAAQSMAEIAAAAKLNITAIVNNSNLAADTDAGLIIRKAEPAEHLSQITGVPLLCHCARRDIDTSGIPLENIYPVDVYVNHIWEKDGFSNG